MSTNATTPPLIPPISAEESPADATTMVLVYCDVVKAVDITIIVALVIVGLIWASVLATIMTVVETEADVIDTSVDDPVVVDV